MAVGTEKHSIFRKPSFQTAGILCAVAAALVYLNTLDCGFCFDDLSAIEENQDLRPTTSWTNLIWNDFWGTPMHIEGSHKSYRPLCVATFRLNYLVHELQPMGYHLVNVLLHSAVCYLYVLLCGVIFGDVWPALIAGLLFAVHPIHTEAVAGVVGRAEMLSALFFLLSIFCYRRAVHHRKGCKWLAGSLLLCLCSMLSKEQGITVVAVCLTYDVFLAQKMHWSSMIRVVNTVSKQKEFPRWLLPVLTRGAVLVMFTVAIMMLRVRIMKAELPVFTIHDNPAVTLDTPYRQLHWAYLCFVNSWVMLNPHFLCADWTMGTIPLITSFSDPRNFATALTFIVVTALGLYSTSGSGRTQNILVFSLSLIVFPYVPASNLFFPVGFVVAERILYVPSMGFSMIVALGIWLLWTNGKVTNILAKSTLFLLLLTHSVRTVVRNRDWYSDITLFTSAIEMNPQNGKVYNNLGHEYERMENFSYAEELFRSASEIQSDDIGAFINLGRVLKAQERFAESEKAYKVAVELMPKGKTFRVAPSHINVYYNLANLVKMDSTRLQEAFDLYQTAISMKPDFVEAHLNKGDLLLKMNRTTDAKASFEKAVYYNPDYASAHYNLGQTYIQLGEKQEAERCYKKALLLDSNHVYSMLSLALLLQEIHEEDKLHEAKELLQQVLALDLQNTRAAFHLALLHLDLQDIQASEEMFLRTLQIDPTHRSALYNLGLLYNHLQKYSEASDLLLRLSDSYPEHLNGIQLLGDCYMRMKRPNKAAEMYNRVLEQNPKHVTALHNLGVVNAETGNISEAIRLFSKTLQLDPSHEAAKKHLQQAKTEMKTDKGSKGG